MKDECTLALLGCPNCGKTTLFNLLTGQAQRTGNWPGVTVQLSQGEVSASHLPFGCKRLSLRLVDLPGANALTPHSPDEEVPLQYFTHHPPDAVILVIDSCSPAQGLYLALQMMTLPLPLILAFNMADRLHALGGRIDLPALESALQTPCVAISARRGENVQTLLAKALKCAEDRACSRAPLPFDAGASIDVHARQALDRYQMIDNLLKSCFYLPKLQHPTAHALDRLALHPLSAYPLLAAVLSLVFYITFGAPGQTLFHGLNAFLQGGIARVSELLITADAPLLLQRLITDGLLGSMSGVLSFLPVLLLFFFATALLEDSGYLARAAFILDGLLMRIGLSGRSFFPLMTGFGCSVPAILSTKALPTARERWQTALLIPYLPCSAKQPVCLFLAAYCFNGKPFFFLLSCYLACLLIFLLIASLIRSHEKNTSPLMMELPAYHLPTLRGALRGMRDKTLDFITRAFTVIFFTAIMVWLLQTFTPALTLANTPEDSLLFFLSRFFQPLLRPLGFSSPYTVSALAAGLLAKENILAVLMLSGEQSLFPSTAAALSFLIFSLLYAPCFASCCALSGQMQSRKRMLATVLLQTMAAWLAALMAYRIFS